MVDELTVHAAPGFWTREKRRDALVITLTLVTGSIDAIGLIRLGGVFTSVMTGNMVFLGIAVSEHSGSIALHTGVAFAAYVLGSFVGARVAGHAPENETHLWPLSVVRALLVEFVIIAVFAAWWEIVRGQPVHGRRVRPPRTQCRGVGHSELGGTSFWRARALYHLPHGNAHSVHRGPHE